MIRRLYMVRMLPDIPPARIESMVEALCAAPEHIPGFVYSRVNPEESRNSFHFVWDHAFVDAKGVDTYMVHPYHANIIDEFLYNESPGAVVEDSLAVQWTDSRNFIADAVEFEMPPPRTSPLTTRAAEPAIFLVERLEIPAELLETYSVALREIYLPCVAAHGIQLISIAQAVVEPQQVFVLWSVNSWDAVARLRAFLIIGGGLDIWRSAIAGLRVGGIRRYMLPAPTSLCEASKWPLPEGTTLITQESSAPGELLGGALTNASNPKEDFAGPDLEPLFQLQSPDATGESTLLEIFKPGQGSLKDVKARTKVRGSIFPHATMVWKTIRMP